MILSLVPVMTAICDEAILNYRILIWAKLQALVVTGWICVHPVLPLLQTSEMSALLK